MSAMSAPSVSGTTIQEEPTLGALVASASRDVSALIRSEIELAKAEVRDDVRYAAVGGGMFAVAGVIGLLAAVLLSFAIVYGVVAAGLAPWLSFLIVGAVYLLFAGLLALIGVRQVKRVQPPKRTIASTKETVAVLKGARRR